MQGERHHFHCLNLDGGLVIDAGRTGGEARFINHSCDPNCVIEKWSVLGRLDVWMFGLPLLG
jgi:histone-lysine N-methyltransferase ASH1L